MRLLKATITIVFLIALVAGSAYADPIKSFNAKNNKSKSISTNQPNPTAWFKLPLPDFDGIMSNVTYAYPNGKFEYDLFYPGYIDFFTITMKGSNDNSNQPIHVGIDFNGYPGYIPIVSLNIPTNKSFTWTFDILNSTYALTYNSTTLTGAIANISIADFVGKDEFWIGYGCHFTLLETSVAIGVNAVPEPGTAALTLLGLAALIGFSRCFRKRKRA